MFRDYTLQTTKGRALFALLGGVIFATIVVGTKLLFGNYMDFWISELELNTFYTVVYTFSAPLIVWGVGVFFIGVPFWLVLHKKGFRTWMIALLSGFLLSFLVVFLVNTGFLTGNQIQPTYKEDVRFVGGDPRWDGQILSTFGWWFYLKFAARVGLLGSVVALTIWRIAYRRLPPC